VAGTGNREKFGKAFNDRYDYTLKGIHGVSETVMAILNQSANIHIVANPEINS
jgi:hypothetical protein